MKKQTYRKVVSVIAAVVMILQFASLEMIFADTPAEEPTKFTFSDSGIDVTEGDFTGYKISGTELTINASGTYEVSGSCSDGSIKVKKGTEGVNLILGGISLTSSDSAPLCFNKSTGVTLTAKENTVNDFADTEKNNDDNYADNENAENAVIKCKDGANVIINGSGTINITANGKNGIKSGASTDDEGEASLTIDGAALNIEAPVNDAINAEALLSVKSGTLNISAADDALHSDYTLIIGEQGAQGPCINISSCYEGLEGANITICSGNIDIHSEDDGINAANSDLKDYSFTLDIMGGSIYVDAEKGDGIDSNGTLTISDGTVEVFSTSSGANSPLDSDGTFTITGGTVLAVGNSGMAQTPSSDSQSFVVFGAGRGGMQQFGRAFGENENMQPPEKPDGEASEGQMPQRDDMTGGNAQRNDRQQGNVQQNGRGQGMKRPMQTGGSEPNGIEGGMQNSQTQQGGITISAGDRLALTDSANNTIYSAEAVRSANYVFYSAPSLSEDETYTLNINETAAGTATVSDSDRQTARPGGMPNSDNSNIMPENPDSQNGQNGQNEQGVQFIPNGQERPNDRNNQNVQDMPNGRPIPPSGEMPKEGMGAPMPPDAMNGYRGEERR